MSIVFIILIVAVVVLLLLLLLSFWSLIISPDVYSKGDVYIGFWTTVVCHTIFLTRNSWKTNKKGDKKTDRNLVVGHHFANDLIRTMYMFFRGCQIGNCLSLTLRWTMWLQVKYVRTSACIHIIKLSSRNSYGWTLQQQQKTGQWRFFIDYDGDGAPRHHQ